MLFYGLSRVFSTVGDGQYEAIGAFWDAMADRFGRENLRGLGYGWTENTITYAIGLKNGALPPVVRYPGAVFRDIELPGEGWLHFTGRTENLSELYADIYADGTLLYEIEEFYDNGDCEVFVIRA